MKEQPVGGITVSKYMLLAAGFVFVWFAVSSNNKSMQSLATSQAETARVIELATQIHASRPLGPASLRDVPPESPNLVAASLSGAGLAPSNLVKVTPERSGQRQPGQNQTRRTRIELADAKIEQLVRFAIGIENTDPFTECISFELTGTQNSMLWNAAITLERPVPNQTSSAKN